MLVRIFFSLSCLIISTSIFAQNKCDCFERLRRLAEYQYSKQDYKGAYNSLVKAFTYKDSDLRTNNDELFMAEMALKMDKPAEVRESLLRSILVGADPQENLYVDTMYNAFFDDKFKKEATEMYVLAKAWINNNYLSAIDRLMGVDQFIRSEEVMAKLYLPRYDSINFSQLVDLIKEYGYPNYKQHGFDHSTITVLLMHASVTSDSMYHQVLDILEDAHKNGYVSNSYIAMIIDRHRDWVEKKPMLYGNWAYTSRMPKIEDIKTVDDNRYSRNLLSLASLAEEYSYKLPEGYKAKPYPANYFCDTTKP